MVSLGNYLPHLFHILVNFRTFFFLLYYNPSDLFRRLEVLFYQRTRRHVQVLPQKYEN